MDRHFRSSVLLLVALFATAGALAAKTITLNFTGTYYQGSNHSKTGTFAGTIVIDNQTGQVTKLTFSRDNGTNPSAGNCPSMCSTALNFHPPIINYQATSGFNGRFFVTQTSLVGITTLTPAPNPAQGNAYGNFVLPNNDAVCANGCGITAMTYTPGRN